MTTCTMTNDEIERRILDFFEDNLEMLKMEGGHALAPYVTEMARQQVLLYWRKLHEIAEKVTDTEVKLNLPQQRTPKGRPFGIEGVVDIVRENDRVVMYDIKTHAADEIRENTQDYERQLNVYAHIWQNLRNQQLDETTIICTQYPPALRYALDKGDLARQEHELARWNPLIDIPFDEGHVDETIADFARVVDEIEDGHFAPPSLDVLRATAPGAKVPFATHVCRNCDARFSCNAYREFVRGKHSRSSFDSLFKQYLDDFGTDDERDEVRLAGIADADPQT